MSMNEGGRSLPRVLRVESMPLDCGSTAIVVELDQVPSRAWTKSLKRAMQADEGLDSTQPRFDGRFVYVVDLDGAQHRAEHRVLQALSSASASAGLADGGSAGRHTRGTRSAAAHANR